MFKFILLSISVSWIDIGLESPAKCIKYFGLVFFKYFLIELIFKIFNSFLVGKRYIF